MADRKKFRLIFPQDCRSRHIYETTRFLNDENTFRQFVKQWVNLPQFSDQNKEQQATFANVWQC